jgi:hypothetical protein
VIVEVPQHGAWASFANLYDDEASWPEGLKGLPEAYRGTDEFALTKKMTAILRHANPIGPGPCLDFWTPLTRLTKIVKQVGIPEADAHDFLWVCCNAWEEKVGAYFFEVIKLENNTCCLRANQSIIRNPSMCTDGGKIKGWPKGGGYGAGSGKGKGWSKWSGAYAQPEDKWCQASSEWW